MSFLLSQRAHTPGQSIPSSWCFTVGYECNKGSQETGILKCRIKWQDALTSKLANSSQRLHWESFPVQGRMGADAKSM